MTVICQECARKFVDAAALSQHTRSTHKNPNWIGSKQKSKPRAVPICPTCGADAVLSAGKFGIKAAHCGLWSWNGKPLVARETHAARIRAHDAFDALWKSGRLSRGECYRRLQVEIGLSQAECHISLMDEAQARKVVEIVRSGRMLDARHNKVTSMELT